MLYRQVVATGVACAAAFCLLCIFDERHRMGNVSQTNLIMKKMKRRKKRRNWRRRKKKRLKKSRRNSRKRRKKSRRRRRKKSRRKSRKRKKKREQEQEQEEEELEAGTTHKKTCTFFLLLWFDSSMSTPICPLLQTAGTNVWPTAVQLHTRLYGSKDELEKTATFILQTGPSV